MIELRALFPGIVLLTVLTIACGEQKKVDQVLSSADFLPAQIDSIGIIRSSETRTFEGEALYEHINGGAEVYHWYSFVEVATVYYSRGETEISVDVYHFADADNAYGLYSTLRPDEPRIIRLGVEGFASEMSLNFVKGQFVIKLIGYDESSETSSAIGDLARVIEELIPGTTEQPQAFSLFPSDNRIPASDKNHARSFLGQGSLANVYSQDYDIDGDTLTLFLTEDPSGDKLLQWTDRAGAGGISDTALSGVPYDDGRVIVIDDSYYGRIVAGAKGDLLLGVVNYREENRDFLIAWLNSLP